MFRKIKLFVLFCLPCSLWAQDFHSELQAIVSQFDSSAAVSLAVKVSAYQKKGGKLIYSADCRMERDAKNNSYSKLGELEYISCGGYQVQLDHQEKYMYVAKKSKNTDQGLDIDVKSLKKLLGEESKGKKTQTKASLLEDKDGVKSYRITGMEGLTEVVVELDTKSRKIRKIVYHYGTDTGASAQYIVLEYTRFSAAAGNFDFELKHYFTQSNGKYIINGRYKHYKLIAA